jgi:ribosomal protein S18 acetylase RimI-like enzyme
MPDACPAFLVRRARSSDLAAVHSLAQGEPLAAAWPVAAYARYVQSGAAADAQVRVLFVACLTGDTSMPAAVAGFLAASMASASPCEIENLAVAPALRRCGIATRLLESVSLWCRAWSAEYPAELWLEVRAGNGPAQAFYRRRGFSVTGYRPGYYADGEDAVLLGACLRP